MQRHTLCMTAVILFHSFLIKSGQLSVKKPISVSKLTCASEKIKNAKSVFIEDQYQRKMVSCKAFRAKK